MSLLTKDDLIEQGSMEATEMRPEINHTNLGTSTRLSWVCRQQRISDVMENADEKHIFNRLAFHRQDNKQPTIRPNECH